ncbi:MAG TPA: flippase-like domain-containing protein [Candidatus Bathyarchaeia archaeon]|nr:flippase-like domain-containing protein [Candidatus Bathyarchaeia archaeon]
MNEEGGFPLKRTGVVVIAAGLFVFLLYLYFFVPFGDFSNQIKQANPIYYSLAFGSMLLSAAFYSLAWQRLLHVLSVKCSFLKAFQIVWVGSFVDLLVPAESVSGDISRVYLMSKESSENTGKVVASVIGHRVLSMTMTLGGLVVSSVYFAIRDRPPMLVLEFVSLIGASTLAAMVLIFYFSRKREAGARIVEWLVGVLVRLSRGRWKFARLKESAEKMLKSFYDGIDTLVAQRRRLLLPASLTMVAWALDLLISVLVFRALDTSVPFSAIAIVYTITLAIQTAPLGIPGEIGILDIAMASLYTLLRVPIVTATVATVLIRIITMWMRLLIGGLTVQWLGIKGLRPKSAARKDDEALNPQR